MCKCSVNPNVSGQLSGLGFWWQVASTLVSAGAQAAARGKMDTMKQNRPCGMTMNSGMIPAANKMNFPDLPPARAGTKGIKIYGKANPRRTWGECARMRLAFPSNVTGPMVDVDPVDFVANYPDPVGVLGPVAVTQAAPTPTAGGSQSSAQSTVQPNAGGAMPVLPGSVGAPAAQSSAPSIIAGVPNSYLMLGGAVLALLLLKR